MGQLLYANALGQDTIKLKSGTVTQRVRVPHGMMEDVVRPHFGETVVVMVRALSRNGLVLETIDSASNASSGDV
jgi:hypothetical protein